MINWLVPFCIFSLIWILILLKYTRPNCPPGPICLPILGVIPYIIYRSWISGRPMNQKRLFLTLKENYGDISQFTLGNERFILLSSYEIIYEAHIKNKETFSGRPKLCGMEMISNNFKGILLNENESWKNNRSITLKSFHSLGVGKTDFNKSSQHEIEKLIEDLYPLTDQPINVEKMLFKTYFNLINRLIFGSESTESDKAIFEIYNRVRFLAQNDFSIQSVFWKFRSNTIVKYFFPIMRKFENDVMILQAILSKKCKEKLDSLEDGEANCLIDYYVGSSMETDEITQCCVDLILAGVDTVSSFMYAIFLLIGKHESYQNIIRNEIKNAEKEYGLVSFEEKRLLPFTQAFIEECHRYFIVVPTFQHRVKKDICLRGFLIKPSDTIFGEQFSLNFNESIWENPNLFDPYRFYDKKIGCFRSNSNLIQFGIGKRSCLGEGIGKVEVFNTLIATMRQFTLHLTSETLSNYENILSGTSGGIIHCPLSYKLVFSKD